MCVFFHIVYRIEPELGKWSIEEIVNLLPNWNPFLVFTILLVTFLRSCIDAYSAILKTNIHPDGFNMLSPHIKYT